MGTELTRAETGAMLPRKRLLLAAAIACAALAIPSVASAEDFCVGGPAGCTGTPVAANGLKVALTGAQSNGSADRFFLAPGIFTSDQFTYQSAERLQIIGAGAGKTILRGNVAGSVLTLGGDQDSSVSELRLEPTGAASSGLTLQGTHAGGVAVDAKGVASLVTGVQLLGDSTFDDGSVDLGAIAQPAVTVYNDGAVTDSTLTAPAGAGVLSGGNDATVRRSTLDAKIGAAAIQGHLTVSDTLVDLRGNAGAEPAYGVYLPVTASGTTAAADADRLTIVGSAGTTYGLAALADGANTSATVHMRDSVISGVGVPVGRQAQNGGTARVTSDRSAYPTAVAVPDSGPGAIVETDRIQASPHFADGFHLAADSPLIDAGTPDGPPAGATDRDGRPRASDGDGNCTRVTDIGAFEYQGTTAKAVASAAATTVATGQAVGFSAAGSCIPGPEAPAVSWSFDDGAGATGSTVTHAFQTPGRHTATVIVTDAHAHSAQATAGVDVTARSASVAPRVTRLRVAPTRVQIGTLLPKLVRAGVKRPLGTIGFRLSKPATITLRFAKLTNSGKAHPVKTKVRVNARKGSNRLRFAARLSRRSALAPGKYRLTAVATDATGARSKRATTRFTAVKR
jgi:hypothetical protein